MWTILPDSSAWNKHRSGSTDTSSIESLPFVTCVSKIQSCWLLLLLLGKKYRECSGMMGVGKKEQEPLGSVLFQRLSQSSEASPPCRKVPSLDWSKLANKKANPKLVGNFNSKAIEIKATVYLTVDQWSDTMPYCMASKHSRICWKPHKAL